MCLAYLKVYLLTIHRQRPYSGTLCSYQVISSMTPFLITFLHLILPSLVLAWFGCFYRNMMQGLMWITLLHTVKGRLASGWGHSPLTRCLIPFASLFVVGFLLPPHFIYALHYTGRGVKWHTQPLRRSRFNLACFQQTRAKANLRSRTQKSLGLFIMFVNCNF